MNTFITLCSGFPQERENQSLISKIAALQEEVWLYTSTVPILT